ncbi:hypothetical protein [Spirosoma koreense]
MLYLRARRDRKCAALSGGETMKLTRCSLAAGTNTPDQYFIEEIRIDTTISMPQARRAVIS